MHALMPKRMMPRTQRLFCTTEYHIGLWYFDLMERFRLNSDAFLLGQRLWWACTVASILQGQQDQSN